jgi:hypothetical protein
VAQVGFFDRMWLAQVKDADNTAHSGLPQVSLLDLA